MTDVERIESLKELIELKFQMFGEKVDANSMEVAKLKSEFKMAEEFNSTQFKNLFIQLDDKIEHVKGRVVLLENRPAEQALAVKNKFFNIAGDKLFNWIVGGAGLVVWFVIAEYVVEKMK